MNIKRTIVYSTTWKNYLWVNEREMKSLRRLMLVICLLIRISTNMMNKKNHNERWSMNSKRKFCLWRKRTEICDKYEMIRNEHTMSESWTKCLMEFSLLHFHSYTQTSFKQLQKTSKFTHWGQKSYVRSLLKTFLRLFMKKLKRVQIRKFEVFQSK